MDYRDPLVSIVIFLSLIVISVVVTHFVAVFNERRKSRNLQEFLDKFEFDKDVETLFTQNASKNALLLLAIAFEKEGDYEKSLNIYQALLKHSNKELAILEKMAQVYLKAGFLHKAKESLLEILKATPTDITALNMLFIVDDRLKDFDEMENVLEILQQLNQDITKQKAYLEFLKAKFYNDKAQLASLCGRYDVLKRDCIEYFLHSNPQKVFEEVTAQEVYENLDLFYPCENLPLTNQAFVDIMVAKKAVDMPTSGYVFELEVLKHLPCDMATLEFEYICHKCKHIFPIYDQRCPHCKELFIFKPLINITKS
ncbi:MAG: tetratricopeptide repeat protein [Epsilonproteobacteria bacterium]|nr:tetratricopeptide repeat protein [Campylobacterota bacterium]